MWYRGRIPAHGGDNARIQAIVDDALRGKTSEEQAHELQRIGGPEAVVCVLLAAAGRITAQDARIADLQL